MLKKKIEGFVSLIFFLFVLYLLIHCKADHQQMTEIIIKWLSFSGSIIITFAVLDFDPHKIKKIMTRSEEKEKLIYEERYLLFLDAKIGLSFIALSFFIDMFFAIINSSKICSRFSDFFQVFVLAIGIFSLLFYICYKLFLRKRMAKKFLKSIENC